MPALMELCLQKSVKKVTPTRSKPAIAAVKPRIKVIATPEGEPEGDWFLG